MDEVGRNRSNAIDKRRKVEEPGPKIDEAHEELKDTDEIGTDEMAWITAGQNATVEFQKKYLQAAK